MSRCYLHFGTPKTGSTTIQKFLYDHADSLLSSGILIPRAGTAPAGGQYPLVRSILGLPVAPRFSNAREDFLEEFANHPNADILVSDERMSTYLFSRSRARSILSYFSRLGVEIVLLGYFRNQPQRANSGYAQGVKALQIEGTFEDRLASIQSSGVLDYSFWTEFANTHDCQLLARPFSAQVRANGIVRDFFTTLGIGAQSQDRSEEQLNISPGPCMIAALQTIMRHAAECDHTWTQRERHSTRMLVTRLAQEPQFAESPFCGLDTKTARAIQAYYQASNDRFAEVVWGQSWATVFKEDVEAEFKRNVFEPETASREEMARYRAILERLRSGMQAISPHHVKTA